MINVKIEGLDDVLEMIKDLEISEQKQRAVLNKCGETLKDTVTNASPNKSGYIKNSIKKSSTKAGGGIGVEVKVTAWDAHFTEFGSSKIKKYVGWHENAVNGVENDLAEIIAGELLK